MWRIMFWVFLGFGLIGFQPLPQDGKAGKGGKPTLGVPPLSASIAIPPGLSVEVDPLNWILKD